MEMNNYQGYGYQNPYTQPYGYQFYGNPVGFQQINGPVYKSSLTEEEIKSLQSSKTSKFDLNIDPDEYKRAQCNHRFANGQSAVRTIAGNDGEKLAYCPICGESWHDNLRTIDEVKETIDTLYDDMQSFKGLADCPIEVIREFMPVMKMIKKFPDLYKYGMSNVNNYLAQSGMYEDNGGYNLGAMLNSILSPSAYNYYPQYGQPQYGQPQQGYYQQPQYGQPQQPQYQPGMMAQPNVNPMQAGGFAPNPVNPQFAQQANMMMGGSVYAQPQPYGYYQQPQPTFGVPQPAAPVAQPDGSVTTANADGTNTNTKDVKI